MNEMVNNIRLAWKLTCMLITHKTCNPKVRFPKYEFNNKFLGSVTLFRVTLSVTWIQLIYIYIYILTCWEHNIYLRIFGL